MSKHHSQKQLLKFLLPASIGRVLLPSMFLLTMAFAPGASAFPFPMPVGSTSADNLIFNFDFTSSTPPPLYAEIDVDATFSPAGPPVGDITEEVFDGLAGTGGIIASDTYAGPPPFSQHSISMFSVAAVDGVFSVGLRIDHGTVDLASLTATAITATGSAVEISGVPTAVTVPEPATLALLGLAFAGMGWARRRKLH